MTTISKFRALRSASTIYTVTILALGALFTAGSALATSDTIELAIDGYDPVAYFTTLQASRGSAEISYEWLDYKWQFVSEENKKLFVADAMRYMPNYGGYCSYDPLDLGHDHVVDPTSWRIVDDKLYLFYSEKTAGQKMPHDEWEQVKAGLAQ